MAARWLTAGATLGVSELVRAVDPKTANALCDNNPLGAVANAVEHRSLGPLSDAVRVDRAVTSAVRNVPIASAVSSSVTSAANYYCELSNPLNAGGFGISNRGPQETPDGYAYACALVANEVYKDYNDRKRTLTDKDGWWWKALPGWRRNKLAVYTHARSDTCIIGLRGTADGRDVVQDLDLFFSEGLVNIARANGRTKLSCRVVWELVSRYKTVYLTGHSLGGFLAYQLALPHPKVQVHIFNAGANGLNVFHHAAYQLMNISDRATHHHVRGDPISQGFSEAYVTRKDYNCSFGFAHAHAMGHFILPEHR